MFKIGLGENISSTRITSIPIGRGGAEPEKGGSRAPVNFHDGHGVMKKGSKGQIGGRRRDCDEELVDPRIGVIGDGVGWARRHRQRWN